MSEDEYWRLTFSESYALNQVYRQTEARKDRRAAMAAWPWITDTDLDDVARMLGHGFIPMPAPPPKQEPGALLAQMQALNTLAEGKDIRPQGRDRGMLDGSATRSAQ